MFLQELLETALQLLAAGALFFLAWNTIVLVFGPGGIGRGDK